MGEPLRRSIVMLPPGHLGLHRNAAIRIIEELQSLERGVWRYRELLGQVRRCWTRVS